MRTIVLHYHLFKNAGTSVDRILQNHYGDAWVTREFTGENNTADVTEWIACTPQARAFSSHTMMGPLPRPDGVRIIPVLMLRDPVARIRSAYRFERRQDAETWGAQLARTHDFEGYVRARLDRPADRQCRNFHTHRLAAFVPGPEPELDRAIAGARLLQELGVLGRVEAFGDAMRALARRIAPFEPGFAWDAVRANVSEKGTDQDTPELLALLDAANADDRALIAAVTPVRA